MWFWFRWRRRSSVYSQPWCLCSAARASSHCGATNRLGWIPWPSPGPTPSAGTPPRPCCWRCAPQRSQTRWQLSGIWWCRSGHQTTANTRRCSGTWPRSSGTFTWIVCCPEVTGWAGDTSQPCTPCLLTVSLPNFFSSVTVAKIKIIS